MTLQTNKRLSPRAGFTLLELTVVLALMVIVSAVSYPAFEGWFQGHRLQESVDKLRTLWVKARTRAMEEGRPYRFAYKTDGLDYRLAPHDLDHWPDMAQTSASVPFSGGNNAQGLVVEESLPDGVHFSNYDGTARGADGGWSQETILFWPDGTARIYTMDGAERPDTQVFLAGNGGQTTVLHLRGLTGGVTVFNAQGR